MNGNRGEEVYVNLHHFYSKINLENLSVIIEIKQSSKKVIK